MHHLNDSILLLLPQASLPVQQYLSMPFEQTQKQTEVARHLPPPLYVLFVQANAYGQACGKHPLLNHLIEAKREFFSVGFIFVSISDKNLTVSITGDVDEAKALSKPPEDSQGTNTTIHACNHAYMRAFAHVSVTLYGA